MPERKGKGGKCGEWGKIAIDMLRQTKRKWNCLDPLFATAGVGFKYGLRHITCFASTTERGKREPKTQPEELFKSLKSNKTTSSITESKAFFSTPFPLCCFSGLGSFC